MPQPNELIERLATVYVGEKIHHPNLKAVTFAQWLLESGRGTSDLARLHFNFGGLKYRPEMAGYATKISYAASDGVDNYCKFSTLEGFVNGYWRFLERAPYSGWEDHVETPEDFIGFIGPIYTPTSGYADRVLSLVAEAQSILDEASSESAGPGTSAGAQDLGTIVLDPGHGGISVVGGSSPNNAISVKGTKEKKLALECMLVLAAELRSQAEAANERIKVVLTRTTDVNVGLQARARFAYDNRAKLFICLHFNGGPSTARGTETFYRAASNGNTNLNDDREFCDLVQQSLLSSIDAIGLGSRDRGVKPDTATGPGSLRILRDSDLTAPGTDPACRAAYVELEFITNARVETSLISGPDAVANRRQVMANLARAVRGYMRTF